jgi:hypothetical protein
MAKQVQLKLEENLPQLLSKHFYFHLKKTFIEVNFAYTKRIYQWLYVLQKKLENT